MCVEGCWALHPEGGASAGGRKRGTVGGHPEPGRGSGLDYCQPLVYLPLYRRQDSRGEGRSRHCHT